MNESPHTFELPLRVQPADIDELGHVNNVSYLRWVEQAALAHWKAEASAADQARLYWIITRNEIDYKMPAYLEDEILARTWVGTATALRFERHTEILRARDRAVLARCRTIWCPFDVRTRKPAVLAGEVRARFSQP